MTEKGKLYAIGTGPGASDLLTIRAVRILESLDILYAPAGRRGGDSLAYSIVKAYVGAQVCVKQRHFPMSNNSEEKTQAWNRIANEIEQDVNDGRNVGFISLGDAMLFSTWVFLLQRLENRIAVDVVPGISSFSAIAAKTLFPMAMESRCGSPPIIQTLP